MIYYKNLRNLCCFKCLFNKMKPVHPVNLVRWFTIILICQSRIRYYQQTVENLLKIPDKNIINSFGNPKTILFYQLFLYNQIS